MSSRVGSNLVEVKLNWWESSIVVEYVCGCGVETTSDLSSGELLHFSQLAGDSNRSTLTFPGGIGADRLVPDNETIFHLGLSDGAVELTNVSMRHPHCRAGEPSYSQDGIGTLGDCVFGLFSPA